MAGQTAKWSASGPRERSRPGARVPRLWLWALAVGLQLSLAAIPDGNAEARDALAHHDRDDDRKLWSGVASDKEGTRLAAVVGGDVLPAHPFPPFLFLAVV